MGYPDTFDGAGMAQYEILSRYAISPQTLRHLLAMVELRHLVVQLPFCVTAVVSKIFPPLHDNRGNATDGCH